MCTKKLLSACPITLFTFTWLARIFFVKLNNVFKLSLLNLVFWEYLLEDYFGCFFSTLLSDFKIIVMSGGENIFMTVLVEPSATIPDSTHSFPPENVYL